MDEEDRGDDLSLVKSPPARFGTLASSMLTDSPVFVSQGKRASES